MKIGLLTFHNANNYGAVLQAYGLQTVLEKMGHHVEFVDYRNDLIESKKQVFSLKYNPLHVILYRLATNYYVFSRISKVFDSFRKSYLKISSHRVDKSSFNLSDFDCFIVGSDQVWNPLLTGGVDPFYWGEIMKVKPVIGYAVSSNDLSTVSLQYKDIIKSYIKNFSYIGVRESRLHNFLLENYKVSSQVVLDPTILAGKEIFNNIARDRIFAKPYLLVYDVEGGNTNIRDIALSVSKDKNLEIVVLGYKTPRNKNYWPNTVRYYVPSVTEWVSCFKYADFVVCRSFHGTVFSVLFERQFYSVKGGNMARVETFLKPLNLQNRIIDRKDEIKLSEVEYDNVPLLLSDLRKSSYTFLIDSVKNIF